MSDKSLVLANQLIAGKLRINKKLIWQVQKEAFSKVSHIKTFPTNNCLVVNQS